MILEQQLIVLSLFSQKSSVAVPYKVVSYMRDSTVKAIPWTSAEFRQNRIVQENYFNICRQHKEK